jgi:hypothetical protein
LAKRPIHEFVCQSLVLIGSFCAKFLTVPDKMPFKIMTVFKWHGFGNAFTLYIGAELEGKRLSPVKDRSTTMADRHR